MSDPDVRRALRARREVIPGGVNSPVRAFRAVGGEPVFIARAEGARLVRRRRRASTSTTSARGARRSSATRTPTWSRAVQRRRRGRPLVRRADRARGALRREGARASTRSIAKLRCVSSGTEATMSAIRVARGFTKRDVIVKFEGCYHGHADHLLVKAGSGARHVRRPRLGRRARGRPRAATLTLPFNDLAALDGALRRARQRDRRRHRRAGRRQHGLRAARAGLPRGDHRRSASSTARVSIFDEVMTGCRLARGGAQERFGLTPDMTALGKIIGGGMPLAAYGGRDDIMNVVAPLGPVYQAGTLSGNPVAVARGPRDARAPRCPTLYDEARGARRRARGGPRRAASQRRASPACVQRVGSMITLFFREGPVRSWADAAEERHEALRRVARGAARARRLLAAVAVRGGVHRAARTPRPTSPGRSRRRRRVRLTQVAPDLDTARWLAARVGGLGGKKSTSRQPIAQGATVGTRPFARSSRKRYTSRCAVALWKATKCPSYETAPASPPAAGGAY